MSPSRAPVLSFARYFQAPATQAIKSLTVLARGGREHVAHSGLVPQASEFLPLRQLFNLLHEEETSVGPHMQTHSQPPS